MRIVRSLLSDRLKKWILSQNCEYGSICRGHSSLGRWLICNWYNCGEFLFEQTLYDQFFSSIENLNLHFCDHCKYQDESKSKMKIPNSKLHTKGAKYVCDVCGNQLSEQKSLVKQRNIAQERVEQVGPTLESNSILKSQVDLTCPILTWPVLTWPTLTCALPSWLVPTEPVLDSPVLNGPVPTRPVLTVLSWPILTWPVLTFPVVT